MYIYIYIYLEAFLRGILQGCVPKALDQKKPRNTNRAKYINIQHAREYKYANIYIYT